MLLPNFDVLNSIAWRELLCDWSIYLTAIFHMTGRSKMNEIEERLPDMTLKGILLDVSVSPKKKIKKDEIHQTSNFI